MMTKIDTLLGIAGWILGIICVVNFAMQHGKRWEFDAYGRAVDLVAEDGLHYKDGTKIDGISLAMKKHGPGPNITYVVYLCVAVIAYSFYCAERNFRLKRRLEELRSQQEGPQSETHL